MTLFVDWYFPAVGKPEDHPAVFLASLEGRSTAAARRSLKMVINDIVESCIDWSKQQVTEADERLLQHGAPALSEVLRKYSRKYSQLLKRGTVKTEVEYYLLQGVLANGGVDSAEEKQIIKMILEFEKKVAAAANP
jgi:hypothetical protein